MVNAVPKILNCCPSKLVNAWCVRLGSETFVIMPAHVALRKKEGIFTVSKFLKDLSHLTGVSHVCTLKIKKTLSAMSHGRGYRTARASPLIRTTLKFVVNISLRHARLRYYSKSIKHSQRTNKHYHDENMSNL